MTKLKITIKKPKKLEIKLNSKKSIPNKSYKSRIKKYA